MRKEGNQKGRETVQRVFHYRSHRDLRQWYQCTIPRPSGAVNFFPQAGADKRGWSSFR